MHVCTLTQAFLGTRMKVKGQLVRLGPSAWVLRIQCRLSGGKCLYLLTYLSGSEVVCLFIYLFVCSVEDWMRSRNYCG